MFSPTNHKINIVGAAMLKHQQWRKKYEERRKNYIEWIGEDTTDKFVGISLNCGERGVDKNAGQRWPCAWKLLFV